MVFVTMPLHLSEVSEAPATDVALNLKVIAVFLLMLFEISYVRSTVFVLLTFVNFSRMVLCMTDKVCFSHETSFTAGSHTHMSFYFLVPMLDFMSV